MSSCLSISCDFSVIGIGWTFGNALRIIVHSSLHFWQRNRPGFVALYGIHVEFCFDDVFLYVNVSLLVFDVYHFLSYFFLN